MAALMAASLPALLCIRLKIAASSTSAGALPRYFANVNRKNFGGKKKVED